MEIPGAYHQGITNEWRKEWPYGTDKIPTPEQYEEMKKRVYDKYPLPTSDQTKKIVDVTTKTGAAVVGAFLLWEVGKWTIAILAAPATGGGSLAVAAVTP